jgi:hypothetical protein
VLFCIEIDGLAGGFGKMDVYHFNLMLIDELPNLADDFVYTLWLCFRFYVLYFESMTENGLIII